LSSQVIGKYGDKTIIKKDGGLAEISANGSVKIIEPQGILFLDYIGTDAQ
jgi:hypothetical protein